MQSFRYRAISKNGKEVRGVLTAYDEAEAVLKIKEKYDIVVKLEEVKETEAEGGILSKDLSEPLMIGPKPLSLLCSQFAILLKAGLPLSRTVQVVETQTQDKYLKKILKQVEEDTAAGYGMAQSFETRTDKMPVSFIETVRAGEESGTLEASFDKLAKYFEKQGKISGKVKNAMIYPACLAVLAVIVVIVVVNVAVPAIAGAIFDKGGDLPGPTKVLLGIYNFCQNYWWVILAVILAIVVGFTLFKNSEKGRVTVSQWALNFPVIGNINRMNVASQFAGTMTTLLTAGLPMSKCLESTGRTIDNYVAGRYVSNSVAAVEEGKKLEDVFKNSPYLPSLLVEMAGVGEESGSLEDTLTTIGLYYDSEVEEATAKAMGFLEPAITVFLGAAIGFIVIALYLPMFNMY